VIPLGFLDFILDETTLLLSIGAFFAGLGAFLSGLAALRGARRRGEERARETA
jgi:hypothetical protein